MKRCIIFCAAGFSGLLAPLSPGDFVIAADGGYAHTRALGIQPDLILGDFDSLGYVPEGAVIHPVEKDDTDAGLAIAEGLNAGCDTFWLYGSLDGPRLDHSVANFQALMMLASRGAAGYLIGQRQIVTLLHNGALRLGAQCRGDFSVFAVGGEARGVTLRGLKYGLEDHTLTPDFPLGVSNSFTGVPACVSVREGSLLLIYNRENGIPEKTE